MDYKVGSESHMVIRRGRLNSTKERNTRNSISTDPRNISVYERLLRRKSEASALGTSSYTSRRNDLDITDSDYIEQRRRRIRDIQNTATSVFSANKHYTYPSSERTVSPIIERKIINKSSNNEGNILNKSQSNEVNVGNESATNGKKVIEDSNNNIRNESNNNKEIKVVSNLEKIKSDLNGRDLEIYGNGEDHYSYIKMVDEILDFRAKPNSSVAGTLSMIRFKSSQFLESKIIGLKLLLVKDLF